MRTCGRSLRGRIRLPRGAAWRRRLPTLLACLAVACAAQAVEVGEAIAREGLEAHGRGEWQRAADLLEPAVRQLTLTLGDSHPATLQALQRLAGAYAELSLPEQALPLLERVVARRTATLGARHPETLDAKHDQALVHAALGQLTAWLALAHEVLLARTEVLGERHPDTLESMSSYAGALGEVRGRDSERLEIHQRMLGLCLELYGLSHRTTVSALNNIAVTLSDMGRLLESAAVGDLAVRIATELHGDSHPSTLTALSNQANTLGLLGRLAERVNVDERVLRLRTQVLGERHPDTLMSMSNLAHALSMAGRLAEALTLSERALALKVDTLGPRHPETLTSLNNLAYVNGVLGRHEEEGALLERALGLFVESLGERHSNTMVVMNNLAEAYGSAGRHRERAVMHERALRLRTEVLGERHPDTLMSIDNLALSYRAQGRLDEGGALHEKAWRLRSEVLGASHPQALVSMRNHAIALRERGHPGAATALLEAALPQTTEALGPRHPGTLRLLGDLAEALEAADRPGDAAALSSRFVDGVEWQRSQPGLSAQNRRSLFESFARRYRDFSHLHGRRGDVQAGLRLAELGKARTLLESMAAQQAGRHGALPAAERDALEDLNRQIAALDQLIARSRQADLRLALEGTRNDLARRHAALQDRLKATYPKYAQLIDVRIIEPGELPGLLPEGAVAVSYVVGERGVGAYLLDSAGSLRHVDLGLVPGLADAVEIWRRAQSDPAPLAFALSADGLLAWRLPGGGYRLAPEDEPAPAGAVALVDVAEVGTFLARHLLDPLSGVLDRWGLWILSPDGPLAQLPFETLPSGKAGQPVIERAQVHYTQSLSVYALSRRMQQQYGGLSDRAALFAMGNPDYHEPAHEAAGDRGRVARGRPQRAESADVDGRWAPLPGTEVEIRAAAALFPGSARVHLGEQASEQQLQQLNTQGELRNYRYLLFSAHGWLSPEQPALSSIVLSLARPSPEADGYVTASEWAGYDLRSDLAVLSACNTGVGRVVSGEGVMGLPFAMFVAGNVNTILTLWQVADDATSEFVTALFSRLRDGRTAVEALAATKRDFARHPRFSHPRYWAPFILIGAG